MPVELPYLSSYKNVGTLFDKIRTAKVPDAVTTIYLAETLGLKSSGDRALIAFLKTLGFLDAAGRPTKEYSLLKNEKTAKGTIAAAVKKAYEPLFASNEKVNQVASDELKGLVAQVAGSDESMTAKIVGTFKAVCAIADFDATPSSSQKENPPDHENGGDDPDIPTPKSKGLPGAALRPDFHYNIQIHLPANGTEETYINIFNAVRNVFK